MLHTAYLHTTFRAATASPSSQKEVAVSAHLSSETSEKPNVAFAMGDPAGISPELAAKLIAADEFRTQANLVVLGDFRILEQGAKVAGVAVDVDVVLSEDRSE